MFDTSTAVFPHRCDFRLTGASDMPYNRWVFQRKTRFGELSERSKVQHSKSSRFRGTPPLKKSGIISLFDKAGRLPVPHISPAFLSDFQRKSEETPRRIFMESCPRGRRCSTRNRESFAEHGCGKILTPQGFADCKGSN